ncbi:NAD(P)H-hydrate epimerase [Naumannella halotolerans]|uniref:Bifunctional NAD(P)H-hydrate repair enzyme n=1 Tax=Naumannella halotolerans TaxID=993414 RepID=A0A4R7JA40_9ACTN|nr:NAD(P)H-hydrate epimerase [Naumannella halotolerans]TDT34235.1 hydroxyethylthiazole kinase-like uncharacterized protein yjeF/hydroxyethylthiazole kinase-like uncharacterized protein yjeF [Naumannella halotolerans]
MRYAWSVAQIRAAEQASPKLATGELMQRAADAVAKAATTYLRGGDRDHLPGTQPAAGSPTGTLILVGPGNNGADGLWAGQRLATAGERVRACAVLGTSDEAAGSAFTEAGGEFLDVDAALQWIAGAPGLIIDAMFGIGARPGLQGDPARLAEAANAGAQVVLAVDLPSGLDADTGELTGTSIRANSTVTFGGYRQCHLLGPAGPHCGAVEVAGIGIDLPPAAATLAAWTQADLANSWPVPGPSDNKYSRGVLGIDTGSQRYPGAAVLSCIGATWSGAGMIRYVGRADGAEIVRALPNVTLGEGRVQAWLLGSGWGDRTDAEERVGQILDQQLPTVIDADALSALGQRRVHRGVLLTPHAGELARLLDSDRRSVEQDPIAAGRAVADRTGATVLLKGANQYVFTPDADQVHLAIPGPAWTGQAGSGDVLAGVCGTLLAAGLDPAAAAAAAASLQAITAAAHPGPYPPQDLARFFPETLTRRGIIDR